jgi:hypothetical protein
MRAVELELPGEPADRAAGFDAMPGRQEPGFFGPGDSQLFGTMHLPDGPVIGAIVIAPPIFEELAMNYRREVLLARLLAAEGVAALRFHYRGTGHSDGSVLDLTFDSMLDDLQYASVHLRDQVHVDQPMLLGTRLAGLLVMIGNRHAGPLALWEPVLEGSGYFRDLRRVQLADRLAQGDPSGVPLGFADAEVVDHRGYAVTRKFFNSANSRAAEAAPHPGAALLVQLRPQPKLGDDFLRLVRAWQSSGSAVDWLLSRTLTGWWLTEDVHRGDWSGRRSIPHIRATADWIVSHCKSSSEASA